MNSRIRRPLYIFPLNPDYVAARSLRSLRSNYSWKEIYVSNLQHVFTRTYLEDMDLFKTQPCKYFILWFNFNFGLNFSFLCFELIIKHYHTQKQRKITFKPEIKLNHNIYMD